jgi:murein DD-endopeptidase MepM/ murein hydrolase activator NlpD
MFPRLVLLVLTLVLLVPGAAVAAGPDGVWPLRPHEVVTGFHPPTDPWGAGHRGVDLLGRRGEPVHAALAGRISFAGRVAGRGVVVVDHGDTRTTYEPVGATPSVGTTVSAGDPIGRLEAVGSHCWPQVCLHWGWIRGAVYLDPLLLVGAGPVRLLPLAGLPAVSPVAVPLPRPPSGAISGAWMGLLVGLAQPVGGHVRVELGGRQ